MSVIPLEQLPPTPARRFIVALNERRAPIAVFVFAVTAIALVVSLLLKPWYKAEATILPPTEGGDVFANLAGLIQSSALSHVGLLNSATTPSDIYLEIMKSRRLREALVKKFDLQRLYKTKGMDRTLKELDAHVWVKTNSSGVITASGEDHDKQRAADMVNFLVAELDRFNRETLQTHGKRTREFLEQRLADAEKRMHEAADALTDYEKLHKVVVAGDAAATKGMSDAMAQRLALQVRRGYITSYSKQESPEVREIDAQLEAFDRQIAQLPALKNEGARLALEAEIQGKVFTLITAQYEEARIQEMRDTPTITLLDEARPPELNSRPKRAIIVVGAALFACALSAGWVAFSMWRASRA
jgi:uncharacterized protein involved in exopolysaccharide biosynthesis